MLKQEVKERWVAALRSGQYKQGREDLCAHNCYCPMGVLAEQLGILEKAASGGYSTVHGKVDWLPEDILPIEVQETLISLNDEQQKSLSEIADYIERNY